VAPQTDQAPHAVLLPGIADIIDDVRSVRQPTAAELEVETAAILDDMAAQQRAGEAAEAARRAQLEAIPKSEAQLAKMAARKAKAAEEEERRRRAAEAAATAAAAAGPGSEEDLVYASTPSAKETPTPAPPTQPPQSYTIAIETDSASHAYHDPDPVTYTTLAAARAADVWTYPSTEAERARAGVFRALWERGYFMGTGIKFGGDLLVYPGAYQSQLSLRTTELVLRAHPPVSRRGNSC
jgi:tRNA-splicing endonuclease subunit Sen34